MQEEKEKAVVKSVVKTQSDDLLQENTCESEKKSVKGKRKKDTVQCWLSVSVPYLGVVQYCRYTPLYTTLHQKEAFAAALFILLLYRWCIERTVITAMLKVTQL